MWMPPKDASRVWGNGANFDNALVAAAYRANKMDLPWDYWNDRCYRTIAAMFMKTRVDRVGTGHHALDDAKTQALRLLKMQEDHGFKLA
jgi:exodeoxyribonuclease VIII